MAQITTADYPMTEGAIARMAVSPSRFLENGRWRNPDDLIVGDAKAKRTIAPINVDDVDREGSVHESPWGCTVLLDVMPDGSAIVVCGHRTNLEIGQKVYLTDDKTERTWDAQAAISRPLLGDRRKEWQLTIELYHR